MAEPNGMKNRPEDPFVRSNRAAGGGAPIVLAGLLGDSERAGSRRLYLTTGLDYFVEFRTEDVVGVEDVPPDQPPFPGLDATRVNLIPGASVDWVRRGTPGGSDPWLLQAREDIVLPRFPETWEARCPGVTHHFGESDFDRCNGLAGTTGGVFGPLPTAATRCGEATCATCRQGTCVTCGRGTCVTCEGVGCVTQPATCQTCGRATCEPGRTGGVQTGDVSCAGTCDDTCATCWETCLGTCVSCRGTCDATCANTCADTCGSTCWGTCAATCETCNTCNFFTCGTCPTDPGWCVIRR